MNKTNIRRLATALLTGELATRTRGMKVGYNQRPSIAPSGIKGYPDQSGFDCGTVACLGGHAAILAGKKIRVVEGYPQLPGMWEAARKFLRIPEAVARSLFDGNPFALPYVTAKGHPTAKGAALVLFNLAETGEVNWDLAKGVA